MMGDRPCGILVGRPHNEVRCSLELDLTATGGEMMKRLVSAVAVLFVAGAFALPALAQEVAKPAAVSHDTQGRDQCLMCHTAGAMEAVPDAPASHAERTNEMCLMCHAADSPMLAAEPPAVSHSIEGRDQCMMCHKAGAMEAMPDAPAGHEEIDLEYCTLCHEVPG